MPVPSMRAGGVALAAALATASAPACEPIFHVPRGFEVERPVDVSASGEATLHLPANARGAVYTNFVGGRPRRPALAAFRLVDRGTGRRLHVRLAGLRGEEGAWRVAPVGGFVAGHVYDLRTSRRHEPGSPFHPALRLVIDAAIAWPPPARAIRLLPRPDVIDGTALTVMTPVFEPGLAAYRDQITSTMQASPPVMAGEAIWNDCTWGDVSVLRRDAACHAITATFSYRAMSEQPAVVTAANRAACAAGRQTGS